MASIYITTDNLVVVEGVYDSLGLLTDSEILDATGTVTVYSDAAHSSAVSGASNLTLTAFSGQTTAPARFYASVPNTVSLTEGTVYYVVATLSATDVSAGQTVKLTLEEEVTAAYKS